MTLAKCKACSAPVIYAETSAGKRMPVNAQPVADGNLRLMLGPGSGKVLVIIGTPAEGSTEPRFTSHFATCLEAARFRRERKTAAQRSTRRCGGLRVKP